VARKAAVAFPVPVPVMRGLIRGQEIRVGAGSVWLHFGLIYQCSRPVIKGPEASSRRCQHGSHVGKITRREPLIRRRSRCKSIGVLRDGGHKPPMRPSPTGKKERTPPRSSASLCDALCDCPTGKSPKVCPALRAKYSAFVLTQISRITPPVSRRMRGVGHRHKTRGEMRWTRKLRLTCAA